MQYKKNSFRKTLFICMLIGILLILFSTVHAQYPEVKLLASDGAAGDWFGISVSISGDYALVSAYYHSDVGYRSGSAYIFKRDGASWIEQAKLTASDGAPWNRFGYPVSISGDYVLVSAYYHSDVGYRSGSAYIFYRNQGGADMWGQQAKLTASDAAAGDYFGAGACISGDYAIVGSPYDDDKGSYSGSAYIFYRNEGGTDNWGQQTKLLASDGAVHDLFGNGVSIFGDYALVGAHNDDDNGTYSGSAYIFKRDGSSWIEQAKLLASDGAAGDWFGMLPVSIFGDDALVGALYDDIGANSDQGSAYIFHRNGTSWIEQVKLTASDGAAGDLFGYPVSISGGYVIVGAPKHDDNGTDVGSAYVYNLEVPGVISGTVTVEGSGLAGVIVKLLDGNDPTIVVADGITDAQGDYTFSDIPVGTYQVMIIESLGYSILDIFEDGISGGDGEIDLPSGGIITVDFTLNEEIAINQARSKGYWKHQFDVYVRGRGHAQETETDLYDYIDKIHQLYTPHFNIFDGLTNFEQWQDVLTVKGQSSMEERAISQLAALVLNFASLKIGQYQVVSVDNHTAGDVLTYVSELLIDGDGTNDEFAKDLAEQVNLQQTLAAGLVNPSQNILYKGGRGIPDINWGFGVPKEYALHQNYPNPFNPTTTITYAVKKPGMVTLKIYDIFGRQIKTLVNQYQKSKIYSVKFNARDLASGVYYYKLQVGNEYKETKKMILIR